jgi:hypothetical protein
LDLTATRYELAQAVYIITPFLHPPCGRPLFPRTLHCETMDWLLAAHSISQKEHSLTSLRQRMIEDMKIRNLAATTQISYLQHVSQFARYFGKSPDILEEEQIRAYQAHLIQEKKVAPATLIWPYPLCVSSTR